MDPIEPQWRTNSSFSPPLSRRWDLISQQDGSDVPICGSSLSSHSKGSGIHMTCEQQFNHYHSVSDGALSYFGSPFNSKAPRCTPLQKFDLGEFTTPNRGARPESSTISQPSERCFITGVSSLSNSIGSGSPPTESGRWDSTGKAPLPPRHSISRRSFMSKPVYPLLFHNPVSVNDASGSAQTSGGDRLVPVEDKSPPVWLESDSSPELKFHETLTNLQRLEASPRLDTSSRRHGFRWSNASSCDFGIEEALDVAESITLENLRPLSPVDHRCGLCRRVLSQRSPWSSCRVVRNGDMPIAGVLPCGHVFHADCLEEMTPKTQIHEPPCPVCAGAISMGDSISFSEPLQAALRGARKKPGTIAITDYPMASNLENEAEFKRKRPFPISRRGGNSLMKNNFKKHFSFKEGIGKDLFGSRMLGRKASTSSSSSMLHVHDSKKQIDCIKDGQLRT